MKKINLLAGESSSSSGSTTISNLGLIQLKPLLDIEPTNEVQELYPGDDGVSGYSFIRIKGAPTQTGKTVDASINEQVITPDEGYLGFRDLTVNPVDNKIDSNISPDNIKNGVTILGVEGTYKPVTEPIEIIPTTSDQVKTPETGIDGFDSVTVKGVDSTIDKNIQTNNIRKGVEILGVTGEFGVDMYEYDDRESTGDLESQYITKNILQLGGYLTPLEITPPTGYSGFSKVKLYTKGAINLDVTPSTQEQDFNMNVQDDTYCCYNAVHVNAVTSSIDENIKSENIVDGVNILGVNGSAKTVKNPTDQWNYDLLIHTTGNKSQYFPQIVDETVDETTTQYLIFCNGDIDLSSCLYGFGYSTSYIPFSYHRYSDDLFKKIGDFIYVNATALGGVRNSSGIYVTYDFNDHNIPEKFYYNCGNGDTISVGTSCKNCGVNAFIIDIEDYVITRSFFEYNVNYLPNEPKKTTIKNIIDRDKVNTFIINNESNVSHDNYPLYDDQDGVKYAYSSKDLRYLKVAPRTGTNARQMYTRLDYRGQANHPDTTQCTDLSQMYKYALSLEGINGLNETSFINATNISEMFAFCGLLSDNSIPKKLYFNQECQMFSLFQECGKVSFFPEIIMESDTANLRGMCESYYGETINSPHKKDGTLCKATDINYVFDAYNLTTIGEFDFSLITSPTVSEKDRVFRNSVKLVNLGGFIGLKIDIDLSNAVNLTHDSLMNVINKAATVTDNQKMIFGETNLAKLSDEEKKIATDKGWTLA